VIAVGKIFRNMISRVARILDAYSGSLLGYSRTLGKALRVLRDFRRSRGL